MAANTPAQSKTAFGVRCIRKEEGVEKNWKGRRTNERIFMKNPRGKRQTKETWELPNESCPNNAGCKYSNPNATGEGTNGNGPLPNPHVTKVYMIGHKALLAVS
jgi:hypothetical protein